MARTIRLRRWQKAALESFRARSETDFLAVATPGAGKTRFALAAARLSLAEGRCKRVIVVCPTQALKRQWAGGAEELDLHLDGAWSAAAGELPADLHGIVTTYQQVATSARALRPLGDDAFVIFDEIHHAGDERAWGESVRLAFQGAAERLSLSGTPFRSDTQPIPFVRYSGDEAQPDFSYGYGDALRDRGVVRPVHFPRVDGQMEWLGADGSYTSAAFDDALDRVRSRQRLRTALAVDGEWLPEVLRQAHRALRDARATHPRAGGLVIAIDQQHARGIAGLMRRHLGVDPVVVTSDDPDATARIGLFSESDAPWIVAVRMVSEGVDIPRLRVGVFATTTQTELFFRQAVGRLVRYTRGLGSQRAYLFIPADPALRAHAERIGEERRHSLRRRDDDGELDEREERVQTEEQLSLFSAISAVAVGTTVLERRELDDDELDPEPPDDDDDDELVLELTPLAATPQQIEGGLTPRQLRDHLREQNSARAGELARLTGLSHRQVNGELNRLAGIRRISEATSAQLTTRLERADRWMQRP